MSETKKIPLYLYFDSTVPEDRQKMVREGVRDFARYVPGLTFARTDTEFWKDQAEPLFAKAFEQSLTELDTGQTLLAKTMLTALDEGSKTWSGMGQGQRDAGAILYITTRDLSVPKMTVCFGLTRVKARISVNSISRFADMKDPKEAELCIRRTMVHELGHMFGAPAPNRIIATKEDFGKHCTNPGCVMCQTPNLTKLLAAAKNEYRNENLFCVMCRRDIRKFLRDRGYGKRFLE